MSTGGGDGAGRPAAGGGRRWLRPALAVGAGVVALIIAGAAWLSRSTEQEIDLSTGRIRTIRRVAGLRLGARVEDSALTGALTAADLEGAAPDWRRMNASGGGGGASSRQGFHGAASEIALTELTWKCGRFSAEARRLIAKDVLVLWQAGGNVQASRGFMRKVEGLIEEAAAGGGREIGPRDVLRAWREFQVERPPAGRPQGR